jgi:nitrate reductase assembly molybdenum cofactor insertion protein NarJ
MPPEAATAYEQVTRNMVENLERRFEEHEELQTAQFAEIKQDLKDVRRDIQEIREQLSKRLPPWATFAFGLVTFLAGTLVSFLLR